MLYKQSSNQAKSIGFTLAEVLIVLAIIGVIASMTIPALISGTNDTELQTAAKKAYAEMSDAVLQMSNDHSGDFSSYITTVNSFKPDFMQYFNVIKDCNWSDCVPSEAPSTIYKNLAMKNARTSQIFDHGQFELANGMTVLIGNDGTMLLISIDVNGYQKKPNVFGKDLFMFQILNNQLVPMGVPGSYLAVPSTHCSTTSANLSNGLGCTAIMLSNQSYY